MMATRPASPSQPAARKTGISTRGFSSPPATGRTRSPNRFSSLPAYGSRPSADLAGRRVGLSADIPILFDQALAPHHKLIGRWVATRKEATRIYTRPEARQHIERTFKKAVLKILDPIEFVDLRVAVFTGEGELPPAVAIACNDMGPLDLGWIENSDAPIPWRAATYGALERSLGFVLPIYGYDDLFEEISIYYWDGETDDEAARQCLIGCHDIDPDDLDEFSLPSAMNARRPEWMIGSNAAQSAQLPIALRQKLLRFHQAHNALRRIEPECNAWHFDMEILAGYVPFIDEYSRLPPLTLVPGEQFAREIDDVGQYGMETGFIDFAGIFPLTEVSQIDDWFASLQLGAQFLAAAQDLIHLDPTKL